MNSNDNDDNLPVIAVVEDEEEEEEAVRLEEAEEEAEEEESQITAEDLAYLEKLRTKRMSRRVQTQPVIMVTRSGRAVKPPARLVVDMSKKERFEVEFAKSLEDDDESADDDFTEEEDDDDDEAEAVAEIEAEETALAASLIVSDTSDPTILCDDEFEPDDESDSSESDSESDDPTDEEAEEDEEEDEDEEEEEEEDEDEPAAKKVRTE